MDCVNGALKSSLTSQGVCDNIYCSPVDDNVAVSSEDFFVDDLLDFSKAEVEDVYTTQENKAFVTGDKIEDETVHLSPLNAPPVTVHETELSIPADELADLEWLSNFVDDSTPGYSLTIPAEKLPVNTAGKFNCTEEKCSVTATKARSRRARNGVRVWPLSESSYSSSSSSYTSSSSPFSQSAESLIGKALAKKQKQQHSTDTTGGGGAQPRRCSHCLVQKTPQWRAGPLGAKTLCNACGVRYKSGRLLPEYRPACSPTFSSEKHSNNHRKVMEMRRKKEGDGGFPTPVESF